MLTPLYTNAFKKDVKRAQKRKLDMVALKRLIAAIINEEGLPARVHNHRLSGNWANHWECHIAPDWLLVYRLTSTEVVFERTGTHADLF